MKVLVRISHRYYTASRAAFPPWSRAGLLLLRGSLFCPWCGVVPPPDEPSGSVQRREIYMNRTHQQKSNQRIVNVLSASLLLASCVASVAQAQTTTVIRTNGMPVWVAERLVQKSRQGVEHAVQYVHRTRMIYELNAFEVLEVLERAGLAEATVTGVMASLSPATK
jgi:hypothetical protein